MRQLIQRAMHQSDDCVIVFDYRDAAGVTTRRVASPIRFLGSDRFLALCLCRAEPRSFTVARCCNMRLERAADFLMPVEMPVVTAT